VACPGCAYERLLLTNWHPKFTIINLLIPVLAAAPRLGMVRTLLVFIPYVYLSYRVFLYLLWYSYPGLAPAWLPELCVSVVWIAWAMNLGGAWLLLFIARFRFFRRQPDKGITPLQPIAYCLITLVLNCIITPLR
jgi:hypothetical protein